MICTIFSQVAPVSSSAGVPTSVTSQFDSVVTSHFTPAPHPAAVYPVRTPLHPHVQGGYLPCVPTINVTTSTSSSGGNQQPIIPPSINHITPTAVSWKKYFA